jgi:hypothetical protein
LINSINSINQPNFENSVLIVENVGEALTVQNNGTGGAVLEGVCAVFGRMNNNRRVYEKDEYLPHLSYLNDKISKRQLVGDLDHPPSFDVSLKSASHIIENLKFDGGDKVFIKLRILENTPNGKIAKALLDGGVQLSISSRAAGQVSESGKVSLQRIFTYDLVGEPGFTEAVLRKTVNESLKNNFELITESYNHLKQESIINIEKLQDISESLNFADNYKVFKINNKKTGLNQAFQTPQPIQKNSTNMADFVTREQMDQYSEVLKNQFAGIKKELKTQKSVLESSNSGNADVDYVKLVGFVNYMAEQLEGVVNYADYLSAKVNESIRYTEHVAETTNNSIEYSNYVGEKLNQSIGHQDYLAEKLNQTINYSEYIKENLNSSIKYQNYLAEELDKGLQYTEYVAEGANRAIEYGDYLSENINQNRDYSQYLAEKLGHTIGYTEYIAESLNEGTTVGTKRNVLNGVSKQVNESAIDALVAKVDQVITEVNDKSANAVLESKYPFLKVVSDAKKKAFYSLDTETKHAIVETLNASVWFNEADVTNIMEAVVTHKNQNVPAHIKFMPDEFKTIWNEMNESEKSKINAKSQLYSIKTPYQAVTFWNDLDLRGINERIEIQKHNVKLQKLNESQSTEGLIPVNQVVEMQRGYSQGYIENMMRQANYRK